MSNEIITELTSLLQEVCDSPLLNKKDIEAYEKILMEQLDASTKCQKEATYSMLALKRVQLDMELQETDKKYNKKPEETSNAITKEMIEESESAVMITDVKVDATNAAAKAAITFIKKLLATKTMETSRELTQEVEAKEEKTKSGMFLTINIIVRGVNVSSNRGVNLSSKPQNSVAGVTKPQRIAAGKAIVKIKGIIEEERKEHPEEILVLKANSEGDTEAHTTQTQVVAQAVIKAPALESESRDVVQAAVQAPALESEARDVAQVATKTQHFEDIEVSDKPFS
jgi:hypothetical protein